MKTLSLLALGAMLVVGCTLRSKSPGTPPPAPAPAPAPTRASGFSLTDHDGTRISLDDLLVGGTAVLVFYRGDW